MSDETKDGDKMFEMVFTQRLVVRAGSLEEMKGAAEKFKAALPFLAQFDLSVTEAALDAGDGRWQVINGVIDRLAIEVDSLEALRALVAPPNEIAAIKGETARYLYQPQVPADLAKTLDIRYIVVSKHGGIWIDAMYMQRHMQQMQMRAQQQQQAAQGGGGMQGLQGRQRQ